jgi:hypothetical protein
VLVTCHSINLQRVVPCVFSALKVTKLEPEPSTTENEGTATQDEAAEDKSNREMDEGIGESEIDVMSVSEGTVDSVTIPMDSRSINCDPMATDEASHQQSPVNDVEFVEDGSPLADCERSTPEGGASFSAVRYQTAAATDDNLFIDTGRGEDDSSMKEEGDDPETLHTHSLSQDSGSSRTVEVGDDDIRSPSPAGADDNSYTSSPRVSPSPPVTPSPLAASPNVEDGPALATFATGSDTIQSVASTVPSCAEETDGSKDVVTQKESREDWDQDPVDTPNDDDSIDQRRHFVVDPTVFPLGYERSESRRC